MQNNLPQDPIILFSVLNTKLRDNYSSLNALCDDLNVDMDSIIEKMAAVGYHYDKSENKFC